MVRDKKVEPRAPRPRAQPFRFPSPVRGLVLNENLASATPATARILDNWICTTTGVTARKGSRDHATLGDAVRSMFRYKVGASEVIFAATDNAIYDITAPADPATPPAAEVSGLSSGHWSTEHFGNAGGTYLVAANGADAVRIYDGAAWSEPAITGISPAALGHVWSYANRLFFIEEGELSAWYLAVDAIQGAATEFSLASVFRRGGHLLFGATWSMDAGDGLDDKCVFVTTEGEIAIYEGTNPGDPAAWRLAGLYEMTPPRGKVATMRAGGDLLVATEIGLIPVSEAIRKDKAALSGSAVSANISPVWDRFVREYDNPWHILKWPSLGVMLVIASTDTRDRECLVCNLKTGAWSRWTGIPATCGVELGGFAYVGGNDGKVRLLESGGSDSGEPYSAVYLGNHEAMGDPGHKTLHMVRAQFKSSHGIVPAVTAKVDYEEAVASPPEASDGVSGSFWGVGRWGQARWGADKGAGSVVTSWASIGRTGYVAAPEVQLTFGSDEPPDVELVSVDVTFVSGAVVA